MTAVVDQSIVVNDLLNYLVCNIKKSRKDKLLDQISECYSESIILEAQKVLLDSLPVKKSTRHGRRVKHPDTLVAIYDCIQLIPEDDLPLFVCRDMNDIPDKDSDVTKVSPDQVLVCEKSQESELEIRTNEMNESDYRKEQKQMKLQISEMLTMIKELKEGLQNITSKSKKKPLLKDKMASNKSGKAKQGVILTSEYSSTTRKSALPIRNDGQSVFKYTLPSGRNLKREHDEENFQDCNEIPNGDETSELDALELIQHLIDEDDETSREMFEKENETEDDPYLNEFEEIDRYVENNSPTCMERNKRKRES